MKILYAIQGTGNGHLSRAADIIPALQQYGSLDILVSGVQAEVKLPYPVTYTSKGLSFYFGKKGGINFYKTFARNSSKDFIREVNDFPVHKYDLIVNDFEPITAWAARKRDIKIVGLGHQAALLSRKSPRPKVVDPFGEWMLRNYAPVEDYVGFHFKDYDKNIFTPVVRKAIADRTFKKGDHYTVYLPAYDDKKLVTLLMKFKSIRWHVFSKHTGKPYHVGRISVFPVSGDDFVESVVNSMGVLCGAGFETPAEVLYMEKKLLVVPMKSQYEQKCNAAALKQMGVPVLKRLKKKRLDRVEEWIESKKIIEVDYQPTANKAVAWMMRKYGVQQ